jgi:hypothetical protein
MFWCSYNFAAVGVLNKRPLIFIRLPHIVSYNPHRSYFPYENSSQLIATTTNIVLIMTSRHDIFIAQKHDMNSSTPRKPKLTSKNRIHFPYIALGSYSENGVLDTSRKEII